MDAGLRITHFSDIERLEEIGVAVSIETVGKSYDIATSESMCAIFKTEWFRNNTVHHEIGGHWKGFDLLDLETRKMGLVVHRGAHLR